MTTMTFLSRGELVEEGYFTAAEVARQLRVSRATITRWLKKGFFPNARQKNPELENSPYEIPESDLRAFLQRKANSR